jgi:tRNA threonylcarbamoyladenosine biosynthesis protein TsaB
LALILNIETSTTLCSVALCNDGKPLAVKEIDDGYTHAENLHVFIEEVLKQASVNPNQLRAIAVGKGPGSYTGLRIGVSSAKGLAYALNIPLIGVNTLETMAWSVSQSMDSDSLFCPMLDARRMEVYCAIFDKELKPIKATSAQIIDEKNLNYFSFPKSICFFGDGMPKCREILSALPSTVFIENVKPSASFLGELSFKKYGAGEFENVAYFEPFYLKDFVVKK